MRKIAGWLTILLVGFYGISLVKPEATHAATAVPTAAPSVPSGCSVYYGSFLDDTAQAMLTRLGVTFYAQDKITAFPDPALGVGSRITLCTTPTYTIVNAGTSTEVRSWAKTVNALATEQRLNLGDQDEVTPARGSTLTNGETITIVRVAQSSSTVNVPLDYTVQYQNDPNLDQGTQQIQQQGKDGLRQDTYMNTTKNGVVTSRVKVSSTVIIEPVNEIVDKGVKVEPLGSGATSWYAGVEPMSAANRTLPLGTMIKVTNTANGKSVVVVIADRGPFVGGRVLDLSKDAFAQIASLGSGVINVTFTKD